VSYSQYSPSEDHVASNDDVKYDVNNSYETALDLCGDLAVNAAMDDKNNTTEHSTAEDSVASFGNKKSHTEDCTSYSQYNPSEDHVANNNDDVGYEVNNSYELAWELSDNFAVNPAMGPIYTSPLTILTNQNEWSSVGARFFIWDHKNQGDGIRGLIFNSEVDSKPPVTFHHLQFMKCFFISTLHQFTM
jgi:hypothetical protein